MKFLRALERDKALGDLFKLLAVLIGGFYYIAILIRFPAAGLALIALYLWLRSRRG